jgi:hypothetical protein
MLWAKAAGAGRHLEPAAGQADGLNEIPTTYQGEDYAMKRRTMLKLSAAAAAAHAMGGAAQAQGGPSPADVRQIAKEAYIYGYPLVDGYRVQHTYFVDRSHPQFNNPWNQINHNQRVNTPQDRTVQTPNSDTPYSRLGLDLRAEPWVLSIPEIEKNRYFSVQLIDQYTHNYDYVGTRTTGNAGGKFLIAGPRWKGEKPPGITKVIPTETDLTYMIFRTQLFDAADIQNVVKVQAGYQVEPLSKFLGQPAPAAAPEIVWRQPLSNADQQKSLEMFNLINFVLQFCPVHSSETALRARFASAGIEAGKVLDFAKMAPELRDAYAGAMQDAWKDFMVLQKKADAGEVTSGDVFGTREHLKNNYLYRMAGAVVGIYGNSAQEAIYPLYFVDTEGKQFDAAARKYTVRFEPGKLPPVDAFWSLTMYDLPDRFLVANRLNRYLINSPMLPNLKRDADGGLTILIQHEPPANDMEANWLPAPKGPFFMSLRLYLPKAEALDGRWKEPKAVGAAL